MCISGSALTQRYTDLVQLAFVGPFIITKQGAIFSPADRLTN